MDAKRLGSSAAAPLPFATPSARQSDRQQLDGRDLPDYLPD
jgi:hypothetical protein